MFGSGSDRYAHATYDILKNVSVFETKIFINKDYCGTSSYRKTEFSILIDDNTVYTSKTYTESFNAESVEVDYTKRCKKVYA